MQPVGATVLSQQQSGSEVWWWVDGGGGGGVWPRSTWPVVASASASRSGSRPFRSTVARQPWKPSRECTSLGSSRYISLLHHDEVVAVAAVQQDEAVGRRGLELQEQVHGVVGLQRGQRHEAGARAEGHGVGHDALVADDGVQLAVVDVAVLAQVDVGHAVERQALQVPDEVGRHGGHEALLRHDARLNVVELQLRVVARHLTCGWVPDGGGVVVVVLVVLEVVVFVVLVRVVVGGVVEVVVVVVVLEVVLWLTVRRTRPPSSSSLRVSAELREVVATSTP
ncbi:LOW QUALITY PROTEIN: hypothetical protein CRUP_007885 [Coryphaenoides rupestris]|nr:LOW QUALITY PROTEIN: hypothetical protein CRUP_007885 [Coryphaenoides rupestris]